MSLSSVDESDAAVAPAAHPARAVEVVFLLLVCGTMFFVGLGRFDFIKTEGLRAIVVAEMLEQPGISMPSVHHRPYLKKPPLYAWSTALLARALPPFDEQIARLPSALAATALVLLLYGVAEGRIGRGAGVPAAALALANVTVVDYAMRAELDMGFAFLTTASILLAYPALQRRGATGII
ncbi:MAG: ArnT family glycosyltransferase, partial [Planctomycetota bacterium]